MIFIGNKGTMIALDRSTGTRTRRSWFGGDFVKVAFLDWNLLASINGERFCLDPATGNVRWQNPLKGLGRGMVTIAASGRQQAVVMAEKRQRDQAATAGGRVQRSSPHPWMAPDARHQIQSHPNRRPSRRA